MPIDDYIKEMVDARNLKFKVPKRTYFYKIRSRGEEKITWNFDNENNWPVKSALRKEYLKMLDKQKIRLYMESVSRVVPERR